MSSTASQMCRSWVEAAAARHGELMLFVGSAVSIWQPSSLPSAPGLAQAIIRAVLEAAETISDLEELPRLLTQKPIARLEAVLDEVERHAPTLTLEMLGVLRRGRPCGLHDLVADLIVSGQVQKVYTTNQDLLLESALRGHDWLPDIDYVVELPDQPSSERVNLPRLYKLHGSIDTPDSIRASFTRVGQRLPTGLSTQLEYDLQRVPMLVLGYSGNDVDLRPTFLRSNVLDVLWLEHPDALNDSHLAAVLRRHGRNVKELGCDLAHLPMAWGKESLTSGVSVGNRAAATAARSSCIELTEAVRVLLVARFLRWVRLYPGAQKLRRIVQRRAKRAPDRDRWPHVWRVDFDVGEYHLYYAGAWFRNLLAYRAYATAGRRAARSHDLLGIVNCRRGMGMSLDMLGYGLLRWTYRWTAKRIYRPAIRLLRHIGPSLDRKVARHNVSLLLGRALARSGSQSAARKRLRRLARSGSLPFVRGHALRHLATLMAEQGCYAEAERLLAEAEIEFQYLEAATELADVERNKASVMLAAGKNGAVEHARRAREYYRAAKVGRGVQRVRPLLLIAKSSYLSRLAHRRGWLRSLVLAL